MSMSTPPPRTQGLTDRATEVLGILKIAATSDMVDKVAMFVSMVAVVIDRGLKSGKVDEVIVQPEKALELLAELAKSVEIAMRVNREFE